MSDLLRQFRASGASAAGLEGSKRGPAPFLPVADATHRRLLVIRQFLCRFHRRVYDCAPTPRSPSRRGRGQLAPRRPAHARSGPTRMGSISPRRFASTAPRNETSSQGCATATLMVASFSAIAIRRSYLACDTAAARPCCIRHSPASGFGPAAASRRTALRAGQSALTRRVQSARGADGFSERRNSVRCPRWRAFLMARRPS